MYVCCLNQPSLLLPVLLIRYVRQRQCILVHDHEHEHEHENIVVHVGVESAMSKCACSTCKNALG